MNVLIACEYSGIIRDAFENAGWNAWSCDLLPTESEQTRASGKHYQGNVTDILDVKNWRSFYPTKWGHLPEDWDLLIAHPPCTYLSYAGMKNWNDKGRIQKRFQALEFFRYLWEAPILHICIENPKGCASPIIAKYTQEIHPYYFGDREMKRTHLWLKNLPLLEYRTDDDLFGKKTASQKPNPYQTQICKKTGRIKNRYFTDCLIDNKLKTSHEKSKSFHGIGNAMAEQWTKYIENYHSYNKADKDSNKKINKKNTYIKSAFIIFASLNKTKYMKRLKKYNRQWMCKPKGTQRFFTPTLRGSYSADNPKACFFI